MINIDISASLLNQNWIKKQWSVKTKQRNKIGSTYIVRLSWIFSDCWLKLRFLKSYNIQHNDM